MTTNSNRTVTIRRRIGILLLTGTAGVLIPLAACGTAAAIPVEPILPGNPIIPGNPVLPRGDRVIPGNPIFPGNLNRGAEVGLNPQPLPPGPDPASGYLIVPRF